MKFQFVTFGRGIVLFVLGVAIGTGLFLNSWFSGATLRQQVYDAVKDRIRAPFDLAREQIDIDLEHGLVIRDFRVRYPDGFGDPGDAMAAERIVITVQHDALLSGIVQIRQIDVYGLTLTLRRDPKKDGLPGLPGILRQPSEESGGPAPPAPLIRIHPGQHGSWLVLEDDGPPNQTLRYPRLLVKEKPIRLNCTRAEIRPDEEGRHLLASFKGGRLSEGTIAVDQLYGQNRLLVDVSLEGLRLEREDFANLSPSLREALPPLVARGRADITSHAEFQIDPGELRKMDVDAKVYDLSGSFGNLFTGEEHEYPFQFRRGEATIKVIDTELKMHDFRAEFVSPAGDVGTLSAEATLDWELGPSLPYLDVRIAGREMRGGEFDLRRILQTEVVDTVVDPFRVSGLFDFDLRIGKLPGMAEKVTMDIAYSDGAATFAGHLDPATRRRFGFDYPLERGHGRARFESNLRNSHGLYDEFHMIDLRGYRPIPDAPEAGPQEVEVAVHGLLVFYGVPENEPVTHAEVHIRVADLPIDDNLDQAFRKSGLAIPYHGLNMQGWVRDVAVDVVMNGWVDDRPYATYTIDLADCSVEYTPFPLPVHGIAGRIVKYDRYPGEGDAEVLELCGLHGVAAGGGNIWSNGVIKYPPLKAEEWDIRVSTDDLPIGAAVRRAIRDSAVGDSHVVEIWDKLRPHGTVGALIKIGAQDAEVAIKLRGNAHIGGYGDIDCGITHLNGDLTVKGANVAIEHVKARVGRASLWIEGVLTGQGGIDISSSVDDLHFEPEVQALIGQLVPGTGTTLSMLRLDAESTAGLALRVHREDANSDAEFDVTATQLNLHPRVAEIPVSVKGGPVHIQGEWLGRARRGRSRSRQAPRAGTRTGSRADSRPRHSRRPQGVSRRVQSGRPHPAAVRRGRSAPHPPAG
jgi:hypothetical protein